MNNRPFFPWYRKHAVGARDTGKRLKMYGNSVRTRVVYKIMTDGSYRRLESNREVRRVLELSPRQFRKAQRVSREEAKYGRA